MRSTAIKIFTILSVAALGFLGFYYRDSFRCIKIPLPLNAPGVVFHDKWRSEPGFYNIVNGAIEEDECLILDMAGHLVYDFPHGFCYFFKDGSLLIMNNHLTYYDSTKFIRWTMDGFFHHDLETNDDESEIYVLDGHGPGKGAKEKEPRLTHPHKGVNGMVHGLTRSGQEFFTWRFFRHIDDFERSVGEPVESRQIGNRPTVDNNHLNTVQPLPSSAAETVNAAFRKGNLLINCYLNRTIFIIDRESKEIIWSLKFHPEQEISGMRFLSGVHSVQLLPNGNLFFFVNDAQDIGQPAHFAAAVEMNPFTKKIVWHYSAPLVSPLWGSAYKLANGNALITFSSAGTATEVTPEGRIAWQWVNPRRRPSGQAKPVYRVTRVSKELVDRALAVWQE